MDEKSLYDRCITSSIYLGVGGLSVSAITGMSLAIYEKYQLGIVKQNLGDLNNLETLVVEAIMGFGILAFSGFLANGIWLIREGEKIRGKEHGQNRAF